jgi:hypothetical protein
MKVTLEFNCPEEDEEFKLAINGHKNALVIDKFFEELRHVWKYSENEEDIKHAAKWRDKLVEICNEYNYEFN